MLKDRNPTIGDRSNAIMHVIWALRVVSPLFFLGFLLVNGTNKHQCHRTNLLPDLSAYEEPLASSTLEIVIDEIGEICNISQVGVASIPGQDVTGICIKVAKERRVVLGGILDSS